MTYQLPRGVAAIEFEDIGTTRHVRIVWRSPIRILQGIRDAIVRRVRSAFENGGNVK